MARMEIWVSVITLLVLLLPSFLEVGAVDLARRQHTERISGLFLLSFKLLIFGSYACVKRYFLLKFDACQFFFVISVFAQPILLVVLLWSNDIMKPNWQVIFLPCTLPVSSKYVMAALLIMV